MKFAIVASKPDVEGPVFYVYDNETSELTDEAGDAIVVKPVKPATYDDDPDSKAVSASDPGFKVTPRRLKIQLGLSCNYSCEYCSQRFVPNIDHSNSRNLQRFLDSLDEWVKEPPEEIEFWGGEPFVYWKTLKPLAEALAEKYLFAKLKVITNGSLLTDEIIDWLDELGFMVGISHDGPGQPVRGPDPLDDPQQRAMILKLFERLQPHGRISFNPMLHRESFDRAEVQRFFERLLGTDTKWHLGEGELIDVYDDGGRDNALSGDQHKLFRREAFIQIRNGEVKRFDVYYRRIGEWLSSIGNRRPSRVLGQKCGMDDEDQLTVDLAGNVLTCQNVTTSARAANGKMHRIGHVKALDKVRLNTVTHWKLRDECSKCPVLQACKGSCMFLQGDYFKRSCDNAYSDHVPFFAAAFEIATGAMMHRIEALDDEYELPEDRMDLWGRPDAEVERPAIRTVATPLSKDRVG